MIVKCPICHARIDLSEDLPDGMEPDEFNVDLFTMMVMSSFSFTCPRCSGRVAFQLDGAMDSIRVDYEDPDGKYREGKWEDVRRCERAGTFWETPQELPRGKVINWYEDTVSGRFWVESRKLSGLPIPEKP